MRLRFLLAPGLSLSSLSFMALYPSPAAVGRCFVDGRRGRAFQPSTRTRCFTLSIMPRTEGVSSSSRERWSLLRPRPTSVARWSFLRPIGLPIWVTFTVFLAADMDARSEEHTSELQSLMRISYAVFCLKQQNQQIKY